MGSVTLHRRGYGPAWMLRRRGGSSPSWQRLSGDQNTMKKLLKEAKTQSGLISLSSEGFPPRVWQESRGSCKTSLKILDTWQTLRHTSENWTLTLTRACVDFSTVSTLLSGLTI